MSLDWPSLLAETQAHVRPNVGEGKVADYIPALAKVSADKFGLAVTLADGSQHGVGDADERFSIQSISKLFGLAVALRDADDETLWRRVGREPSGSAFNSIVQLERENGVPRNPFINAGALVVTDTLVSRNPDGALSDIAGFIRQAADRKSITIDAEVAISEKRWADRNRSLLHFMKAYGVIKNPVDHVLDAYVGQCAVEMTVRDLSRAGLFLAFDGRDPVTDKVLAPKDCVHRILALMMTCGHYDMSGDFAFHVGLPGKSGVGGGILAIVPGVASIAVWSPALNKAGNSLAGTLALEHLSNAAGVRVL